MPHPSMLSHLSLPAFILRSPALSILLPITIGGAVGWSVNRLSSTKTVYAALRQPPFRPPAWLFSPVWTVIYGCMGYASHLAYRRSSGPNPALGLYTLQLGLNFLWMPLFFGFRKPVAALLDITALTACVGVLANWFGSVDRTAGLLMWPYAAWLGFAMYLTAGVGYLNGWDIQGTVERYERSQEKKE